MPLLLFWAPPLAAGVALVGPQYRDGRAEQALAAVLVAVGLVLMPIHVLAWLGLVSRASVLACVTVGSLAALALALRGPRRTLVRDLAAGMLRMPWDALRLSYRERHVAVLGLIAFAAIAVYTLWLAYLAPSTCWDGLWYHEAIVGYTLQLGGVAHAPVESRHQYINGYPALAEYAQLFMVVAGGREFVDTVPTLMGCVLLLASYVLLQRYAADRLQAIGFALAIVLVPGVVLQFRSTLIDVTVVAFAAACMALLTRPVLRWLDCVLIGLAIGLLAGSKASGLLLGGCYALILTLRMLYASLREHRLLRGSLPLMAAFAIAVTLAAPRYVQNAIEHHNPVWPLAVHNTTLGIELPGKRNSSPRNVPVSELLDGLLSPPDPGREGPDTRRNGYGNALPYTAFPLALLAALVLPLRLFRSLRRGQPIESSEATLLALAIASALGLWLVPAHAWARLHLHAVVISVALSAWLLRSSGSRRFADGLIGALLLSELVTLQWSKPAWDVSPEQAAALAALPKSARRVRDFGAIVRLPEAIASALEREIGAGDLVVYDGPYLFLANLWNARYSNRVSYVSCKGEGYAERIEREGAKWVIAGRKECLQLLDQSATWERIGYVEAGTLAFRRRPAQPKALPLLAATEPTTLRPQPSWAPPDLSDADVQAATKSRRLKGELPQLAAGPIVGAVTDRTATLWIHADRPAVARLEVAPADHLDQGRPIDGPTLSGVTDLSGSVHLTDLQPSTRYVVSVALRDPATSLGPPPTEASFRTLPEPGTHGKLRIVVGADIANGRDQPIFTQIAQLAPDALFLIGDQMYSDALSPDFASYANKYIAAWNIEQLRELMRHVPTFMVWDDHEIADDYFAGKSPRYAPARLAYELYVHSHNPPALRSGKLYYKAQLGDIGFFVLDTRSDRGNPRDPEGPGKTMLGAEQKADLLDWLAHDKSKLKVLVSSVVMSDHVHGDDSWREYATEREEILGFIERERIDDVLILSGDQHWSAVFLHDRPHQRIYEFLATPLSKGRGTAVTEVTPGILARDDDNFVFGVVDFDTLAKPARVVFTLCAGGKPCRPGAEPRPRTDLNARGATENVPFTVRLTTEDFGVR